MPAKTTTSSSTMNTGMNPTAEAIAKKHAGIRIAHEAMMLDDAQKVLHQHRHSMSEHDRMLRSSPDGEDSASPDPGEEEGMIHVGDIYSTQNPAPQPAQQPLTPQPPQQSQIPSWAIAMAMLGAGGVGMTAADLLKPDPVPPQGSFVDTDTDTDTKYSLDFPEGDPDVEVIRP